MSSAGAYAEDASSSIQVTGDAISEKHFCPVILAGREELKQDILDYIKGLSIKELYILGGPGAIPDEVTEKSNKHRKLFKTESQHHQAAIPGPA